MTNLLAIERMPNETSSYDLWEILRENGLDATVIILGNEAANAPRSVFFEFATTDALEKAAVLLDSHGAPSQPALQQAC